MASALPDFAFEGLGERDFFGRTARASAVFSSDRADIWDGRGDPHGGVGNLLEDIWNGSKSAVKAVGKGTVNAVGARFGLGPIFPDGTRQVVVAPPAPNYTPVILGSLGVLTLITVIALRK